MTSGNVCDWLWVSKFHCVLLVTFCMSVVLGFQSGILSCVRKLGRWQLVLMQQSPLPYVGAGDIHPYAYKLQMNCACAKLLLPLATLLTKCQSSLSLFETV